MELRKIDTSNVWEIIDLDVNKDQEDFVATNSESIIEAYATINEGGNALPLAIYENQDLVGFVMIGFETELHEEGPMIAKNNYLIWRLMIDGNYQGKGYGRKAVQTILDYIRTYPLGQADYVWLSYEANNKAGKALYESFGFKETGEIVEDEVVAVLKL